MTRYKVMASDDRQLRQIEGLVAGRTRVFGTSQMFHFVATGDLPPDLQERIKALGARIVPEETYDLEGLG